MPLKTLTIYWTILYEWGVEKLQACALQGPDELKVNSSSWSVKKNIWKEKSVTQRVQVVSQRKAIFFIFLRYAARRVQTPSSANLTCQDSVIAVFSQKPSGLKLLGCLHTGKVTGRLQSISEKKKQTKTFTLVFILCSTRLETFSEDLCWLSLGLNGEKILCGCLCFHR